MEGESIWFDVDIAGAIIGIPRMMECPEFGFVRWKGRQEVTFDGLFGQFPDTVHPPHIIILIIEISVPIFAHQRTITQLPEVQV